MRYAPLLLLAACSGLNDYRGVIHCHSYRSHDSDGTLDEIVAAAREAGVDFIMMTDHPADEPQPAIRGMHGGVLFFDGAETKGRLWIEDRLVFVAHPEDFRDWNDAALDGMEIYNTHADVKGDPKVLTALGYAPGKRFLSFWDPPAAFLAKWDEMTQRRRFVGIAGNDAHQNIRVGDVQLDPYAHSFRFVNTHVLARSIDDVAESLRMGRAFVAFEMERRASGFRFRAGSIEMGGEARAPVELRMTLPSPAPLRLLRNGVVVARDVRRFEAREPGVYRVEVDQTIEGRTVPWIYSNPIYVR